MECNAHEYCNDLQPSELDEWLSHVTQRDRLHIRVQLWKQSTELKAVLSLPFWGNNSSVNTENMEFKMNNGKEHDHVLRVPLSSAQHGPLTTNTVNKIQQQ